jgi:hypothetical protein
MTGEDWDQLIPKIKELEKHSQGVEGYDGRWSKVLRVFEMEEPKGPGDYGLFEINAVYPIYVHKEH